MEKKQRFFIYDRREVFLLLLLGVAVAVFAFTLGVHLGKRVGPKGVAVSSDGAPVSEVHEASPTDQELQDQAKAKNPASDEMIDQATHDEVTRTGIKLDSPRQVNLPTEARSEEKPAQVAHVRVKQQEKTVEAPIEKHVPAATGRFALQVGSYPALLIAQEHAKALEEAGLKPEIKKAEVKGMTRFRIFVGTFATKHEAQKIGLSYQAAHKIESFIVAKSGE